MKKIYSVLMLFIMCLSLQSQVIEKVEVNEKNQLLGLGKKYEIPSKILKENRPIVVSLPVGYNESKANYPVMYLLDGLQNIKHVIGSVELLAESGIIPPMIIVGIQSLDRARDLTPSNAGQNVNGGSGNAGIPQSGGAPLFLKFIQNELIPFVDNNFRTHPFKILQGHSFGGLFGVFAFMENHELFDAYMIQSPALWWNKEEMTAKAKIFFANNSAINKRIYFGIGEDDGWGMKQELIRYVNVIKDTKPGKLSWIHQEIPDEDHMTARLLLNYKGLKFLFKDLRLIPKDVEHFNSEIFKKNENELKKVFGENTRRPAGDYMNIAFKLIDKNKLAEAVIVLERAAEGYPMYVGILSYLAKQYEGLNKTSEAIKWLEKAINISKKYKLGQEDDFKQEIIRLKKKLK